MPCSPGSCQGNGRCVAPARVVAHARGIQRVGASRRREETSEGGDALREGPCVGESREAMQGDGQG